ncbi:hypothetical protein EDD16DRAFT_1468477 [Pisolithus croceorrhizus]|nr:hypothetical protein EV401DRAFT_448342 [Pisolithus croceorrhizus]KAI6132472.1 hypothetical protein EDD16DRAFT_1468477 [Pisolithus croceorrhizus]KAI6168797.1 hypothetical protein EDD17DRAFT_1685043 [Pisolithus thermaeus]
MVPSEAPAPSLPTLQRLGSTVCSNVDAQAVAKAWFVLFVEDMSDATAVIDLLVDDGFWRDILALTWDFRTYEGRDAIRQFLANQLPKFDPSAFTLCEDLTEFHMPYEDLAWIQAFFNFDTIVGHASGIFRLVPLADGSWKAHTVYTSLEGLRGFPEKIEFPRNNEMNCGPGTTEQEFVDEDPTVVVIGGGHSGLILAARLKMLGVNTLVVERNNRVGDNWRKRYTSLFLHEPFWCDHLPYFPFPPSWPVFTPGLKFANWLNSYARSLDLNVWTSARAVSVEPSATGRRWIVKVAREGGEERRLEVNHVVFATGLFGGTPKVPAIPHQDTFNGQLMHSSQYRTAADHSGKKVTVVGSGPSAHGISLDCVNHGVEVTMVQRGSVYVVSAKNGIPKFLGGLYVEGGHPIDIADRITLSFPNKFGELLHQRMTSDIAELDKDLLEGLRKVGFKLNSGDDDAGALGLVWSRAGGFCIDFGASQKIIDGKIGLKNDSSIARFTPAGLLFEDGSTLDTDLVVFATGYADARDTLLELLPIHLHDSVQPIWGLDKEGELNSAGRELGGQGPEGKKLSGLWAVMGNVSLSRIYSKFIALQIKAYEEGVFDGKC